MYKQQHERSVYLNQIFASINVTLSE